VRAIAMVQTVRLFILAVALPIIFAFFVSPACRRRAARRTVGAVGNRARRAGRGVRGRGSCGVRFRIPGGLIVGAMAASGVLHGGGWVHAFLPVPSRSAPSS